MTVYQKVLYELDKSQSITQKHNNLTKIIYSTEDNILISLLLNYCELLGRLEKFKKVNMHSKAQDIIAKGIPVKENIIAYCTDAISKGKPEWQIMAERNGWTPPKV